ncbi:MAG TPA: ISAzo13 family transposase [Verrucomicrobiales bacterium]|nr:ISAzo13 family transposase [Verrucomicrobiales bacterium]
MPAEDVLTWIRRKYVSILPELDERGRRRWAAAEALSLGRGGITAVAVATGMSDRTVRNGIAELESEEVVDPHRQRRPGGGRHRREEEQPKLMNALDALLEPTARGDPVCPLRWTCKSTRSLAEELQKQGFQVSSTKVGSLLKAQGYSLQSNRKTIEGTQHPDRDEQFEYIARRVKACRRYGEPAISVDTKKKEPLGKMKDPGRIYRRKGEPLQVKTHDFPDKELGKAVPYGVYDIASNEAGVTVGISHDTAEFAVAAIKRWWLRMGKKRYGGPRRMLITADCGGSNNPRTRLWLWELQRFANQTGIICEVCHYPLGTSKWNKIEHRLFCHITRNWQGQPLETLEIVVNLIGSTKTKEGLEVHAWIDERKYRKGCKPSEKQIREIYIKRKAFHGEWNYEIHPARK